MAERLYRFGRRETQRFLIFPLFFRKIRFSARAKNTIADIFSFYSEFVRTAKSGEFSDEQRNHSQQGVAGN